MIWRSLWGAIRWIALFAFARWCGLLNKLGIINPKWRLVAHLLGVGGVMLLVIFANSVLGIISSSLNLIQNWWDETLLVVLIITGGGYLLHPLRVREQIVKRLPQPTKPATVVWMVGHWPGRFVKEAVTWAVWLTCLVPVSWFVLRHPLPWLWITPAIVGLGLFAAWLSQKRPELGRYLAKALLIYLAGVYLPLFATLRPHDFTFVGTQVEDAETRLVVQLQGDGEPLVVRTTGLVQIRFLYGSEALKDLKGQEGKRFVAWTTSTRFAPLHFYHLLATRPHPLNVNEAEGSGPRASLWIPPYKLASVLVGTTLTAVMIWAGVWHTPSRKIILRLVGWIFDGAGRLWLWIWRTFGLRHAPAQKSGSA